MFGTADSFRRRHGPYDPSRLPSLVETDLRATGGAGTVDSVRRNTLGILLAERTGLHPVFLWDRISGGAERMPFSRLAETLAAAGAGILGPRELGVLQNCLLPRATDGSVGRADWEAAFDDVSVAEGEDDYSRMQRAGVQSVPLAGHASSLANVKNSAALPSMQHEMAPTPQKLAESISHSIIASADQGPPAETWPGGFNKPPPDAPPLSPFAVSSPTYAATTHAPPYATTALREPGTPQPELPSRRASYTHVATWQQEEAAKPGAAPSATRDPRAFSSPTYLQTSSDITSPFARGGDWER